MLLCLASLARKINCELNSDTISIHKNKNILRNNCNFFFTFYMVNSLNRYGKNSTVHAFFLLTPLFPLFIYTIRGGEI